MSKKRRQRSTTIRKRIEKRAREEERQRKRQAKNTSGGDDDVQVRIEVSRDAAQACATALADLGLRLEEQPLRGWSPDDLGGEHGLGWLADVLQEALDLQPDARKLAVDVAEAAKRHLLERLEALEMAAPGLKVEWEEGFPELTSAISHAREPQEEEPEEEPAAGEAEPDEGDADAEGDEASGDEDAD